MEGLRSATQDELETFALWEQEPDTRRWLGTTGLPWHRQAFADPDQRHLVTTVGEVHGFALLAGLRRPERMIEVRRMVVDPNQRGNGQGRALLRAVVRHAYHHLGATVVWLDVKCDNLRARHLYESEGFDTLDEFSHLAEPQQYVGQELIVMQHNATATSAGLS